LCKVLDYVVYWYSVAYRNNQTLDTDQITMVLPPQSR
jgi:hypothetical protein